MNKLNMDKQITIVKSLVEGASIRSIERITGVHRDTVMRLGARIGDGCTRLMDEEMRGLRCKHIEVDELWSYVQKKQRHVTKNDDRSRVGDAWTFVALDRETKVVPCFRVGKRPSDWQKLPSTDDYISALCRQLRREKISLLKVIRGGRNRPDGTWFHPKLAVAFARWLSDDFAVWCDLLAHLEVRNTLLIAQGVEYDQRKGELLTQAAQWRVANQARITKSA